MCVEVGRVCVDEDTTIRLLQTVSIASEISLCGNFANSNFRPGEISQVRIFDVAKFRGCEFSLRRNFGKTKVTFASVDAKFQQDDSEISPDSTKIRERFDEISSNFRENKERKTPNFVCISLAQYCGLSIYSHQSGVTVLCSVYVLVAV